MPGSQRPAAPRAWSKAAGGRHLPPVGNSADAEEVNFLRHTLAFALLLAAVAPAQAQVPAQQPQHPTSTPYSGDLSIFEYPDRDKKLQIDRVMTLLHIEPGKNVADLGAGSGWFTVRAARRVTATGTVYAEDINAAAIKYINDRAQKEGLGNVRTILGTPDDPKLPRSSVDAVLMLKVYHEIARPAALLAALAPALKPGARIGIIDRNGRGDDHGLDRTMVEKEMAASGFRLDATYDFTKADGQDYFLIFSRR